MILRNKLLVLTYTKITKQNIELAEEQAINTLLTGNDYELITKRFFYDLTVLGIGAVKNNFTEAEGVTVDYVDPANLVWSYTESPYFDDIYYCGEVKNIPINELKKEFSHLTNEDLLEISQQASVKDINQSYSSYSEELDNNIVQVLYFNYKTYMNDVYKVKQTATGATKVIQKDDSFNPPQGDERFKKLSKSIEVLYEGALVLGTEKLLKWNLAKNMIRPKSDYTKVKMNYSIVAPRMYKGRIESLVKRITGFADMIQLTHLKLQQVMSRMVPDGLKDDQDGLNEFYRQFPRSEEHAFRDETKNSIFNLAKIYEQIDYNQDLRNSNTITQGNFQWVNGVKDTNVTFIPSPQGRFKVSWIPGIHLQNKWITKNGVKYPANEHVGAFGCDSYDISGTTDGKGSKGALHGLTKFTMEDAPPSSFFLEYIARPQTAEIFFEDVLMACVFYGMPILAENNKPRLLYHFKRRGYRGYSMNRPDRLWNKLSVTEKEIGGVPNSSMDMKQSHAAAIEMYINDHVGQIAEGEYGTMYFNDTLNDWSKFDINNRTKYDAAISSGLAIMARL